MSTGYLITINVINRENDLRYFEGIYVKTLS